MINFNWVPPSFCSETEEQEIMEVGSNEKGFPHKCAFMNVCFYEIEDYKVPCKSIKKKGKKHRLNS